MPNIGHWSWVTGHSHKGFTLIEVVVGIAVFALIALGIYGVFAQTSKLITASKARILASMLANEQIEQIRNHSYDNVGTQGGIPPGLILPLQTIQRGGITYSVLTTIRNIDDYFDGTATTTPKDTAPADYKLIEVNISCASCTGNPPLIFTSTQSPKNLEIASTNGSLFIQALDANGLPVALADVHVENPSVSPHVLTDDVTNASGMLQLVDVPPATESYSIRVSKAGYSTEQTYPPGNPSNPNPTKPHATVAAQQVTQLSFSIDKTSVADIATITGTCDSVGNASFRMNGAKLIGTNPNVLKFTQNYTTDAVGNLQIPNLEWDTYTFAITDSSYDLAGVIPSNPISIPPGASLPVKIILRNNTPNSLLVTVLDSATSLQLPDANVRLTAAGYDQTLATGQGYARQTNWEGGGGVGNFTPGYYYDNNGGINGTTTPGIIELKKIGSNYAASGVLTSSTFDFGPNPSYGALGWLPTSQPPEAGANSVRAQIATNNDSATWNYAGPDGTAATYYTPGQTTIHASNNGNRYLRYRATLTTANSSFTPIVSDIFGTYTNGCTPAGQVFFPNLTAGIYTLEVGKIGYTTSTDSVNISGDVAYTMILSQ